MSTISPKPLVLRGLFPATVTPFAADLSVDHEGLRRHLAETAAVDGVEGLVVNAGIAEIMQITDEEKAAVLGIAREVMRPGQLLIAGIEGRSAAAAIREGLAAKAAGADALLVLPPFDARPYRRLSRHVESVRNFFAALDREIDLPMIVFQYPEASGVAYSLDALRAIASLRNVVAIKAANGEAITSYVELWDALHDKVAILPAVDSPPLLGMMMHGTHGALIGISVVGTRYWVEFVRAAMSGDGRTASEIHRAFCVPLMEGVFEHQQGRSPTSEVACVKEALVQLGQFACARVRPPAVDVTPEHRAHVRRALVAAGLLGGEVARLQAG